MNKKLYLLLSKNYLDIYYTDKSRPTILICPGGGYERTSNRESVPVKDFFMKNNFNVAILYYRETSDTYPKVFEYLAKSIHYLKHEDDFLKNKKVVALGFSAGGHLVGCMQSLYKEFDYDSLADVVVLCYSVVSSKPGLIHQGSFDRLLKEEYYLYKDKLSFENNITDNFPPTFIWHTITDNSVSVLNSIELALALSKSNVEYELHLYPFGGHGLSLSNEITAEGNEEKNIKYVSDWSLMVIKFINYKLNL